MTTAATLSPETLATCGRIARAVARTAAHGRAWLDPADLEQEAWAAILRALPAYDPEAGALAAYIYPAALTAARRLALRMGAVATVDRRTACRGEVTRQRLTAVDATALEAQPTPVPTADDALERHEERQRLATLVAQHLAEGNEGAAIRAVLTGELKSSEAAAVYDVRVAWLYQATRATKKRLAADRRLREFVR